MHSSGLCINVFICSFTCSNIYGVLSRARCSSRAGDPQGAKQSPCPPVAHSHSREQKQTWNSRSHLSSNPSVPPHLPRVSL